MSLFNVNTFWTAKPSSLTEEIFDFNALAVGTLPSAHNSNNILISGSYEGLLRVYDPSCTTSDTFGCKDDDNLSCDSSPQDLLLEQHLPLPILQIEMGKFVSATDQQFLAVLHPWKLAVYGLDLSVEESNFAMDMMSGTKAVTLHLQYEHALRRSSFNFTFGNFGGVKNREFICVQSMDGLLSFFEQETPSFACFLSDFLLPGPLAYLPNTDCLVTTDCSGWILAFKYQVMATSGVDQSRVAILTERRFDIHTPDTLSGATPIISKDITESGCKKLHTEWAMSLANVSLFIRVVNSSPLHCLMLVGEKYIYCISQSGKVLFMRKMDYHPSNIHCYGVTANGDVRYMTVSFSGFLYIYQGGYLKWVAKLDHIPLTVMDVTLRGMPGIIVTMSEYGDINCQYLGTEPPNTIPKAPQRRHVNITAVREENKEIEKKIRKLEQEIDPESDKLLELSVSVKFDDDVTLITDPIPESTEDDTSSESPATTVNKTRRRISAHITITNLTQEYIYNISLSILALNPITIHNPYSRIEDIKPQGKLSSEIHIFFDTLPFPTSRIITLSLAYDNTEGNPKSFITDISLPLKLLISCCEPSKEGKTKIVLDVENLTKSLKELFSDLITSEHSSYPANAIGFQVHTTHLHKLTIVLSKSSSHIRLQSDTLEVVWLFVDILEKRIARIPNTKLIFKEDFPIQDYFIAIDSHFECRKQQLQLKDILSDYTQQYRAIQKRMLIRFKDKTPSTLNNLDILLDRTFRQILAISSAIESTGVKRIETANILSCITLLLIRLLVLANGLDSNQSEYLSQVLPSEVGFTGDIGWEEKTDASLTYILKTSLSKSAKDSSVSIPTLQIAKDTTRLKKHIKLLIDRLATGLLPTLTPVTII